MSLSVDDSATESFRGTTASQNDQLRPLHHLVGERAAPLPIRGRPSEPQVSHFDGLSTIGSSGASQARRFHRDSFHERRDHRSFSSEWISSPLLEGFASFHSALNSVNEIAPNLETATSSHEDMNGSLPYLGTCWSHDHSGESSVGSSRSTQSSLMPTDASTASPVESSSLALDDWDILRARSLSTDISSPGPMENFMPFLFPMDSDAGAHQGHPPPPSIASVFSVNDPNAQPQTMGFCSVEGGAAQIPPTQTSVVAHYVDPKPEHQTRVSAVPWPFEQQQQTSSADGRCPMTPSTVGGQVPMYSANMITAFRAPLQQLPMHSHPRPSPPTALAASSAPPPAVPSHMTMPAFMVPTTSQARIPALSRAASASPSTSLPLADIQLLTKLNQCYWKNGRKNLQCFPICPEHNDFYSMKMSNRKHTSVGVCRGPVYTHVFLPACGAHTKPPRTTGQHMKYEFGVGASGTGGSEFEIFVLGKFERVPQRDENNALQELLPAPEQFTSSSEFESFRYSCFQAVEMEERRVTTRASPDIAGLPEHIVRSTWFFLPDVWKVQPMLKKKRKATRSAPAQSFPFCFRVFVYTRGPAPAASSSSEDAGSSYRCLATAASSFFELYSTRTVDRVKRKYWSRADEEEHARGDAMAASMATTPSSTHVAKRTASRT